MPEYAMLVDEINGRTTFTCGACGAEFTVVRSGEVLLYFDCPTCGTACGFHRILAMLPADGADPDGTGIKET